MALDTQPKPEFVCSGHALEAMLAFCRAGGYRRFILVADENTYPILGSEVEHRLAAVGGAVQRILLENPRGGPVVADEAAVLQILGPYRPEDGPLPALFLAVGSGTITDLARFASHRTGNPFLSLPTAPSVDGFTSAHVPLILNGFKITLPAQSPLGIYAQLPVLCAAPRAMIAAGFGDLLGKYTALADWRLGQLLWGEPFDEPIAAQTRRALVEGVTRISDIAAAQEEGVRILMDALVTSGFSMLQAGGSRPASGSEHHLAHFWEMMALRRGEPPRLHGEKVAVATGLVAALYERVAQLSVEEAQAALSRARRIDREAWLDEVRAVYGPTAEAAIRSQQAFLELEPSDWERLRGEILEQWETIRGIAASVPPAAQIRAWLAQVGGAVEPADLGLSPTEVTLALRNAHALRNRFTVLKLMWLLDLEGWSES